MLYIALKNREASTCALKCYKHFNGYMTLKICVQHNSPPLSGCDSVVVVGAAVVGAGVVVAEKIQSNALLQ